MIRRPTSSLATLLLAALLAGCAGVPPLPPPDADPGGRYTPLTTPITALGDTQEHQSTGFPMHDNDSAVDAYVEVAQRPPEQALFGRRLMEWALHSHPDEPFLHLGDVLDLSCRSEAERMSRIFVEARRPGAILPGNHDGLMFGIYAYSTLGAYLAESSRSNAVRWNRACRRGAEVDDGSFRSDSEAFTKRDFIARYIAEHHDVAPPKPGLEPPPPIGSHTISWRDPNPESFLSGVEAELFDGPSPTPTPTSPSASNCPAPRRPTG
jgi:hypothetical protein